MLFKETEIPKQFRSYETGEKFDKCLMCGKELLKSDADYVIEKAIKRYPKLDSQDVVFEYAMCFDCVEKTQEELSEESFSRIMEYFGSNADIFSRMNLLADENPKFENWISKCAIKGTPVKEMEEYVIDAHCKGDRLLLSALPYMIGGEAMDEIGELLSNKTTDFLDGFMGDNLGFPPEFKDILKPRVVLF